jgi:hypothetical protein
MTQMRHNDMIMRFSNPGLTLQFIRFCQGRGYHGRTRREGHWFRVAVQIPKYQRRPFIADWAEATMDVR